MSKKVEKAEETKTPTLEERIERLEYIVKSKFGVSI